MKKILSLVIVLSMLLTSNLAFAQYEAITGIEISGDSFVVSGQNISKKDSVITLQVLKSGASWNDLKDFDYESGDITQYLADFDAVSGIGYGEDYSFTQKLEDGNVPVFRIRFGDGTITYYDYALMTSINAAASADELEAIVKGDAAVWDYMESCVEALSTEQQPAFWQILFKTKEALSKDGTPFEFPSEVTDAAPGISVLARLNSAPSKSDLESLLEDFRDEDMLPGNSYDIYAGEGEFDDYGMSDSQKSAFFSHIYSNIDEYIYIEDFVSDFNENAIFFSIDGGSKGAIDAILSKSDLIDADEMPTYFDLTDSKKRNVCEKIGNNKRYTSIDVLIASVESTAKAERKSDSSSLGSGSSGGKSDNKGQYFAAVSQEEPAKQETVIFSDIADAEWAKQAINSLASKNIISGYGNGTFRPNNFVTREEFVKMLVLTLGISLSASSENFDDIDSSDWCHPYVCAAVSAGIVNGIDDTIFGKGRVITREEMATMTHRAINAMGKILNGTEKQEFADASSISPWAVESCTAMHKAGIINGMGNNSFVPKENVTRAQAAKILYEVMTR